MYYTKLLSVLLVCLFSLCSFSKLSGQNAAPRREVGLGFSGLNFNGTAFNVFYKKQRKENVYRRVRFFAGNLTGVFSDGRQGFSLGAGASIGREKRIKLDDKLDFYHGPEWGGRVTTDALFVNGTSSASFGVNATFGWAVGLMHRFNERWGVNLEMIPSISASFTRRPSTANSYLNDIGFNVAGSNQVTLGLVRMF